MLNNQLMFEIYKIMKLDFDAFLGDDFDSDRKASEGETHRWLFCWDGTGDGSDDCACCLTNIGETCGCICHTRIKQITNFIQKWMEISAVKAINEKEKKQDQHINNIDTKDLAKDIVEEWTLSCDMTWGGVNMDTKRLVPILDRVINQIIKEIRNEII